MEKFKKLQAVIKKLGSVIVAYSGGTDSSFLLKVACLVLDNPDKNVLALTATSSTYPESELQLAKKVAGEIGAKHKIVVSEELAISGFSQNGMDRCFFCKGELYTILKSIAQKEGFSFILDGSNIDDLGDYRPGRKATEEHFVISPLIEAGMTKDDIRFHAKRIGLSNWDKPATACLASRFPYGTEITKEKLKNIEMAEELIKGIGFDVVRVRYVDGLAKIEVAKERVGEFLVSRHFKEISQKILSLGFKSIEVDERGYRMGSMNESLKIEETQKV